MVQRSAHIFEITNEMIKDLTLPGLRVFAANEAFVCGIPRDVRQQIGNWMEERTADTYTRSHRDVMKLVWDQIGVRHNSSGPTEGRDTPYDLKCSALGTEEHDGNKRRKTRWDQEDKAVKEPACPLTISTLRRWMQQRRKPGTSPRRGQA